MCLQKQLSFLNQGTNISHLLYQKTNKIAKLILNRPEALNAFSLPMLEAWVEALNDAQLDPQVRVIVVTGNGRAFSAGGDVKTMLAGKGFIAGDEKGTYWGPKAIHRKRALTNCIHKVALTLETIDKPVICAINGIAVGAGLDMAMMCDIRVAADTAQMSASYVRAGLVPGDGGCFYMPRLVGVAKTLELFWTADMISAQEAEHIGLVNKVVPAGDLEKETTEMAHKIAQQPPETVQMIKRAVYSAHRTQDLRTALDLISSHMAIVTEMDDHMEGVAAIREKRKPVFTGF